MDVVHQGRRNHCGIHRLFQIKRFWKVRTLTIYDGGGHDDGNGSSGKEKRRYASHFWSTFGSHHRMLQKVVRWMEEVVGDGELRKEKGDGDAWSLGLFSGEVNLRW
ncbi:hypothetical protein L6452_09374 [Arctium lappa]|uniref:Uncharacterized protein n=1 Tax=Arctium lappa TaxID=4217 RepID=A0ACB9DK48_ARCLA|nr:hypothetical protein L6452_09374 [Arctium lappa]